MNHGSTLPRFATALALALTLVLAGCQPSSPAEAGAAPGPQASGAPAAAAQGAPQAVSAATTGKGKGRSAVVVVQAETVKAGPLNVQSSTAGTVAAFTQSSVAAQASGTVTTLIRKAGDWVQTGDPVIKLDDTQLKLSLKIAQTALDTARLTTGINADGTVNPTSKTKLQLESAQKTYDSDVALSKIGGISASDLATAQANLEAAKIAVQQDPITVSTAELQVQQAELNLNYATIKAPYSGQISVINLQPGEYVSPSTSAFVLVSRSKIVNFSVTPGDAAGLAHGAKISFMLDGKSYPISLVGVPSAPVNGLVPLQAMLPANFPGGFGTVGSVSYAMTLAQGILVPLPAIQSLENSTYVFRVKDNKTVQAKVVILADSGVFAAVTGIADGDTVVLNPPPGLLPGATVKAVQVAADGQPAPAPGQAAGAPGQPAGQTQGQAPGQAQGQTGQSQWKAQGQGGQTQNQWQGQRKDQNAAAQGGGTR
jgi:multidrug efflux system membrane fusion protein